MCFRNIISLSNLLFLIIFNLNTFWQNNKISYNIIIKFYKEFYILLYYCKVQKIMIPISKFNKMLKNTQNKMLNNSKSNNAILSKDLLHNNIKKKSEHYIYIYIFYIF